MHTTSAASVRFDHLVLCAESCEWGAQWFGQLSGVKLPAGGQHPLMATHNHLSALSEDSFLEIIATDPAAQPVSRVRWFRLDELPFRQRLAASPLLTTWVVATSDLQGSLAAAAKMGVDAGVPVTLTRGDLQWQLGLRADGTLACDGAFPILIQWPQSINPVARMLDQGLRLKRLALHYPEPDKLRAALAAIGADHLVRISAGEAAISADFQVANKEFQLTNNLN